MKKFWTVCKYEFAQIVQKKSFIIGLLITPLFMGAVMFLPVLLADTETNECEKIFVLDRSGLDLTDRFVQAISEYHLGDSTQLAYDVVGTATLAPDDSAGFARTLDSLRGMINRKESKYILVLDRDALTVDSASYLVTNEDNPRAVGRFQRKLSILLAQQRLADSNVNLPVDSVIALTRSLDLMILNTRGETVSIEGRFFALFVMVMLIYVMIITYGATLLRSVVDEKSSRIMEVLVSSVSPFQLMMGKIIGIAGATLVSVLVWVLMGLAFVLGGSSFGLSASSTAMRIMANPVIIVFFVLFLTSGYVLYSTIFALLGSIINSEKEAQNFYFPIVICVMLPMFLGSWLIQQPNSTLAIILSLFPFFAPTMMMARIAIVAPGLTEVSLFSGIVLQAILAFLLILLAIAVMVWFTGKVFRVGILMYGKRPTLPEILKWIKY